MKGIDDLAAIVTSLGAESLDDWRPSVPSSAKGPALGVSARVAVFRRDRWRCRYTGRRLVAPPVFNVLGVLRPEQFPYEERWQKGVTHPLVAERCAVIDHLIPRKAGGTNEQSNLVSTFQVLNEWKGNRTPDACGLNVCHIPPDDGWDGLENAFVSLCAATPEILGMPDLVTPGAVQQWFTELKRFAKE